MDRKLCMKLLQTYHERNRNWQQIQKFDLFQRKCLWYIFDCLGIHNLQIKHPAGAVTAKQTQTQGLVI